MEKDNFSRHSVVPIAFKNKKIHIFELYNTKKVIQLVVENKNYQWYISNEKIDDMSSYIEEELFQKMLVWDMGIDINFVTSLQEFGKNTNYIFWDY